MKEAGIEANSSRIDAGNKGKQTLVLFLLGSCMLSLSFLAPKGQPSLPLYLVEARTSEGGWQVVSVPPGQGTRGGDTVAKLEPLVQEFSSTPHRSEKNKNDHFPATLSLFVNRPVPLNRCRQGDLELLPGVGPHLAARLMDERARKGRITGPDDLLAVPGIGPATLQRLLPLVSFE